MTADIFSLKYFWFKSKSLRKQLSLSFQRVNLGSESKSESGILGFQDACFAESLRLSYSATECNSVTLSTGSLRLWLLTPGTPRRVAVTDAVSIVRGAGASAGLSVTRGATKRRCSSLKTHR